MTDWNQVMADAEQIAARLLSQKVDLAEAEKLLEYFVKHEYRSEDVSKYLAVMSQNPPPRSRRSQTHYRNLREIWEQWRTLLKHEDKARAWGWAVRTAKAKRWE
jgi:hypothetical protein